MMKADLTGRAGMHRMAKSVSIINPDDLEGWVWVNNQVKVYTTITNIGVGTLHYTFPDFAEADNLSAGTTINLPAGTQLHRRTRL